MTNVHHPKITIGMTCFNAEDTIVPAIKAALEQDYPDFEILVVDDGSSDASIEKITEAMEGQSAIRLIRHPENKGYPSALNSLIENAAGEFIAFFDDDDASLPDRLRRQVERLRAFMDQYGTDKALCYTNRNVTRMGMTSPDYVFRAIGRMPPEPHGTAVSDFILWDTGEAGKTWGMFGSCTMMAPTSYLKHIGGFDPAFRRSAEMDLAIRAGFDGAYFIAVDAPLVTQYKTTGTDKSAKTQLKYSLMLREKHKDYLRGKGLYPAALMMGYSRHYGGKDKKALSHLYFALACIAAPSKIFLVKARKYVHKKFGTK